MSPNILHRGMKFDQLIEYNKSTFFFKIDEEKEAGRLVSDSVCFFEKLSVS